MTVIFITVLVVLSAFVIVTYNGLTRLRLLAANAWADIDVQLKRRHELIPNLVAAVQGHAGYERSTLEAVVAARNGAMSAAGPAASAVAEGKLGATVRQIFALAEAYPDLRAASSFLALQRTLTELEDQIQSARRYYNAVVRDLNVRIAQFPSNVVATVARFEPLEFFGLEHEGERAVPDVGLGSPP